MTHEQKIQELKGTIRFLIEKEGRSINYISKLLEVDRKILTYKVKEWNLKKADIRKLSPSNEKWVNKHKQLIKSRLDNNIPITSTAKELGVSEDYLRNIINKVEILNKAKEDYIKRKKEATEKRIKKITDESRFNYNIENLDGETWKEILGYEGYYISNMGRVKRYVKQYKKYILLTQQENCKSGRMYIKIKNKGLSVARLVGFAFVEGHSNENNTIDHKDGNIKNNKADNLQWVSQSINNKLAYNNGKTVNIAYQKNGKIKKIILDGKYEFKTIEALSKFIGKS